MPFGIPSDRWLNWVRRYPFLPLPQSLFPATIKHQGLKSNFPAVDKKGEKMNLRKTISLGLVLIILISGGARAQTQQASAADGTEPEGDTASKIPKLLVLMKRFEGLKAERIGTLDANYLKAIDREFDNAADSGDLKLVTALRDEVNRVREQEPPPDKNVAKIPKMQLSTC